MLEYIILGFLMYGDISGYDLKQLMKRSTSYFYDASFGSIYPALKRLEQKGMVTYSESIEGNKLKKVYQIKDSGKECFMKWIKEPIVFEKSRHDYLVKIFFYSFLSKENAISNLKALLMEIEPVTENLIHEKENVTAKFNMNKVLYRYSTMVYGIEYYQLIMKFCRDLINELEKDSPASGSEDV